MAANFPVLEQKFYMPLGISGTACVATPEPEEVIGEPEYKSLSEILSPNIFTCVNLSMIGIFQGSC
jgi:hypothetical protein